MARKRFGISQKLKALLRRKEVVDGEQHEQIVSDSKHAQMILADPEFKFFRDYLESRKQSILEAFARNKVRPVQERIRISPDFIKVLFTGKKEQEKEMSGEYKFIEQMLDDLNIFANMEAELEDAKRRGVVEVVKDAEK